MSTATRPSEIVAKSAPAKRGILLVFCCTLLGAAAQVLMKSGAAAITSPGILGILTNLPVMAGYCLYGISTVLLVLALKDGELSILYPVIALTYVWVMVLSVWFFREALNAFKVAGVSTIIMGVCVLGRAGRKP
ncbi:MAG: hypothetical protein IT158_09685 [Bryobacterales bacterium]|nr:hypothetical protein [Bryobacterales bacterium]